MGELPWPGRNPQTLDEAQAPSSRMSRSLVHAVQDIPALLAGFNEDCVVRFGDLPEFRGKNGARTNCSAAVANGSRTIG